MTSAETLAAQLVALDLDDGEVETPLVVDDERGHALVSILDRERVLGVAVTALEAGELEVTEATTEALISRHDKVMAQSLRTELMAVHVSEELHSMAVRHRVLKGAALAHTVARSSSERSFRDVDVLIGSDDIDRSVAHLQALGATRAQPQLREGFDAAFGKSVTLKLDDVEIDVHRLLCPGPFGVWMHPGDLFVLGATISLGGVDVPILDPTDNLVHACYHVALGQVHPVLSNLRDVALLASGSWDSERFDQTVRRWKGVAVIRRAVQIVEKRLDIELPVDLGRYRSMTVPADQSEAIEPYLTADPNGRFAALAPATFKALPPAQRVAYARAVGFPEGSDPRDRVRSLIKRQLK